MPVDSGLIMFAHELADTAGEIIRPYFRRRIEVTDKGLAKGKVFDPVTVSTTATKVLSVFTWTAAPLTVTVPGSSIWPLT